MGKEKEIKWCDMETLESPCYNCCCYDFKNNKCSNWDNCPHQGKVRKGFFVEVNKKD